MIGPRRFHRAKGLNEPRDLDAVALVLEIGDHAAESSTERIRMRRVTMTKKKTLRSSEGWFGRIDKDGFVYRSWMKNQGWPNDLFDGRPVIGICNTWSELTPCNGHFRELAECVKRGVWEAGGFPLEFPVMSLGETPICVRPPCCSAISPAWTWRNPSAAIRSTAWYC